MSVERPVEVALEVVPKLARLVTKLLERDVPGAMTIRQFRVLARLSQGDDHIGELAARAGVRPPSMSEAIHGLVVRGWVDRTEDPGDRRRKTLRLTKAGEQVLAHAERVLEEAFAELLGELSGEEQAALTTGLDALGDVLDRRWAALLERVGS